MINLDSPFGVRISGIGYELGEELISNEHISSLIEVEVKNALGKTNLTDEEREDFCTSPQWILKRTGIKQRYFALGSATSDLAVKAARKAFELRGNGIEDCEFILVATVTPDYLYSPPTAALVQHKIGLVIRNELGLKECFVADVTAACSSFAAALRFGYSLLASGQFRCGVVVGADKMSTSVTLTDRGFAIVLGDAAAAVVLETASKDKDDFLGAASFFSWADGSKGRNIIAEIGGSANPLTLEFMEAFSTNRNNFVRPDKLWQDGKKVLEDMAEILYLVKKPEDSVIGAALAKAKFELSEIDIVFFHQANSRILDWPVERMRRNGFRGIVFNTIDRFANTTSATAPLGMAVAYEEKILQFGQRVLICVFGGGYTAGTAIFKWSLF